MAGTQTLLSQSRERGVSLADLVRIKLRLYAAGTNTNVDGPAVLSLAGSLARAGYGPPRACDECRKVWRVVAARWPRVCAVDANGQSLRTNAQN